MDIQQLIRAREIRKSRLGKPSKNFFDTFTSCISAAENITSGEMSKHGQLLERATIICTVTAIEVYFRDILEFIFNFCSPKYFEPVLKSIHQEKYDIYQLIDLYRNSINPLELVVESQSFQNVEKIDKVFSQFLGKGLWTSVVGLEIRVKDSPEKQTKFSHDDFIGLESIFSLRHELVHNPEYRPFLNDEIINNLWSSAGMIMGADLLLTNEIIKHKDPLLDLN